MAIDHASAFVRPARGTLNLHPLAMPEERRFGDERGDGEVHVQVFRCSAQRAPYLTRELFHLPPAARSKGEWENGVLYR